MSQSVKMDSLFDFCELPLHFGLEVELAAARFSLKKSTSFALSNSVAALPLVGPRGGLNFSQTHL